MPTATIVPQDRIRVEARQRWEEKQRARCAQAMRPVADELEREWRANESDVGFTAVTLAHRLVMDLEGQPTPVLALPGSDEAMTIVLTRFATAIRAVPALAPEDCPTCRGLGYVHVLDDQGEVCPSCGGERVLRFG